MSTNTSDLQKILHSLQLIFFTLILLYFGQTLFIPLFYGLFIAIVVYPVCKWLEHRNWPRSLAITVSLSIVVVLFAALIALLVMQLNAFQKDFPELKARVMKMLPQMQLWIENNLHISAENLQQWWQQTSSNAGNFIGAVAKGSVNALFMLFLTPVFAALFLYSRRSFVHFLEQATGSRFNSRLHTVLDRTIHTYHNFIKGMILVYLIVGTLNSIGLLALGIRHAVLFGFLTAIMTIIPYIGIFISALLPISVAWLTKDSFWYPLGVVAVFAFVQYLEANVIFPRVVATKLNVSTWATLVAILAGGILWGVSGMILFIPFVGILKIVTDNMPGWAAVNHLLSRHSTG